MIRHQTIHRIAAVMLFSYAMAFCVVGQSPPLMAAQDPGTDRTSTQPPVGDLTSADARAEDSHRPIQLMVELEMPPAAAIYAEQSVTASSADKAAATQAHLAAVEAAQLSVVSALEQLDADVIYRVQRVYNGILVAVQPAQIDAILATPGVAAVHPMTPKQPDRTRSVPFINAPSVWSGIDGFPVDGEGMTIAIIDTGIDYLHADFGGSQDYVGNNSEIIGDVLGFPGPKVVAGYDFAGDSYDVDAASSGYDPFPNSDPDPMDCYGHGTHVAGSAAGYGVTSDDIPLTYRGPYDTTTFDQPFTIGPGVAPEAKLIALKVFGCQGSSNLIEQAIEWAVDPNQDGDFSDHVDVINMSLGSTYGSVYDPAVIASDNAALIGVIVVASAGNSGDTFYVVGSPAISDRTISVAAIRDHLDASQVAAGGLSTVGDDASDGIQSTPTWFTSRGPRLGDAALKPDISAPGESIVSARAGAPGTGARQASGTSMAAPHMAGAMALLRQLHPSWRVEDLKALAMNTARLQSAIQLNPYGPTRVGSGTIDLANALNTETIAFNADDPGRVGISFGTPEVIESAAYVKNLRIYNDGENPATFLFSYHSIVDTPGVDIAVNRESVTAPAGGYANVPVTLTANAVDMRHTRAPNVNDMQSLPRHWLSEESGHILLWPEEGRFHAELSTEVGSEPLVESYGDFTYDPQTARLDYAIRLADFAAEEIATIQVRSGLPGSDGPAIHDIELPAGWVDSTLPITGTSTLTQTLEPLLVSSALHLHVTTTVADALSLRGPLIPTPAVLHVPVYAAPRPASDMRASDPTLVFSSGEASVQAVRLAGHDLAAQDPPVDYASLVSVFELRYSSLRENSIGIADGRADANAFADLQYVGVTDDFVPEQATSVGNNMIYFGIAAYGDWSTPNQVSFSVYIDSDEDGIHDYRLFNSDAQAYRNGWGASDAFVAAVENLSSGEFSDVQLLNGYSSLIKDTNPFNTNVMVLPVKANDIGLSENNLDFAYRIQSINNTTGYFIDTSPPLMYDLAGKVIDPFTLNPSAPTFEDLNGAEIGLRFDTDNLSSTGDSPNLLLLHHQNSRGNRAEVVETRFDWPVDVYLPSVSAAE